jgi:hypothetical protein
MSLFAKKWVRIVAFVISALVGGIVLTAGVVTAATTISTDISTGGMLSVTGTSTLMGNVGVASSTPFARLSVQGVGTGTGLSFQITNSANTPGFSVNDNGTVLIGTSTDPFAGAFPGALIVNSMTNLAYARLYGSNTSLPNAFDLGSNITNSFYRFQQDERNLLGSGGDDFNIWYQSPTVALVRRFAIESNGTAFIPDNLIIGGGGSANVSFGVATSTTNATTTIELGKPGQNKGTCLVMYDATGAVQYVTVQSGALLVSSVSCK